MNEKLDTRSKQYTERLLAQEAVRWKRLLDLQMPYRWHQRRLKLGFTLDVGCGLGRNLRHLNGDGVGIDHNPTSVAVARSRGLTAFLPEEFHGSHYDVPERFDSILIAHVVEHMTEREAQLLLARYVGLLKPGGRAVLIAPQERGFRSDPTHLQFMDFEALERIAEAAGLVPHCAYSFPLHRCAGRLLIYNEFVSISRKPP